MLSIRAITPLLPFSFDLFLRKYENIKTRENAGVCWNEFEVVPRIFSVKKM